jgi:uncharacterized 2Fe-2S/4Fe-4S cluster protein (DUF4445 family)
MIGQVTPVSRGINVRVEDAENLLRVAMHAGIYIDASCGGEWGCGKYKVAVESGKSIPFIPSC